MTDLDSLFWLSAEPVLDSENSTPEALEGLGQGATQLPRLVSGI